MSGYIRPDVARLLPAAEDWILESCSQRVDYAQVAVFLVESRGYGEGLLPLAPHPFEITRLVVAGALRDLARGLLERACVPT